MENNELKEGLENLEKLKKFLESLDNKKELYNVVGYWFDEESKLHSSRLVVSADSPESAIRYFTEGSEDWQNYTEEDNLLVAYNQKASNIIETTFKLEVKLFNPDVVV